YSGDFYIKNSPPLDGPQVGHSWDALFLALQEGRLMNSKVGFELELLPVSLYQKLVEKFPYMDIVDISPLLRDIRKIKTPEEIRRIKIVCKATESAIDEGIQKAQPGMTELELANEISYLMVKKGIEVHCVQVATAPVA